MSLPAPAPLFNPLVDQPPLSPVEILAGPYGLVAFTLWIPFVVLLARRAPRAALIGSGLTWLLATLNPVSTLVLLAGLACATLWLMLLARLRTRRVLGPRGVTLLVWIGLHAMILPLWWQAGQDWYPSQRLPVLHMAGFSYFLFRYITWGTSLAADPAQPPRPADTLCWLLYAPCMRLGPVMSRSQFLERFDAWNPRTSPRWGAGLKRFGGFALGAVAIGFTTRQLAFVAPEAADFFTAPEHYPTHRLLRAFYVIPIHIYLLLWTYNELAAALSRWIGIPVDNNFNWLPMATSVRDFWRRWHVTVGAWLREQVYIPLGGSRRRAWLNPFVVFIYCGLWHGASWSFVAWGLSQAAAIAVERGWDRLRGRLGRWAPRGPAWVAACWLLTLHYQLATIVMFADFEHMGLRFFRELATRLT